jgi:hypothetical protein
MNESEHKLKAERLVKKALKLRDEIGAVATWCDDSEVGRYTLNMLINNLDAMNNPSRPTIKLLR